MEGLIGQERQISELMQMQLLLIEVEIRKKEVLPGLENEMKTLQKHR